MYTGMGALKSYKCSKGHVLKGKNLYIRKDGTRECRPCSRERERVYRERKRSEKSNAAAD